MPLFRPILRRFEDHLKQARRSRIRQRMRIIIEQDREDRLAAATGWRPSHGVSAEKLPCPTGCNVVTPGGRDAPR